MMYLTAHLKSYNNISNGKRHIRITPYKTKHDLLHEIFFDDSQLYQVIWVEKKVSCKKRVYTCFETCHPAPDNLANEGSLPDNENIAMASMKSRDERVTTKRMQHQIQTRLLLQLQGLTFNSLLREATTCARVLGSVIGFWVPCSGPESTRNGELPEGHSRTWGTYGTQWNRSK